MGLMRWSSGTITAVMFGFIWVANSLTYSVWFSRWDCFLYWQGPVCIWGVMWCNAPKVTLLVCVWWPGIENDWLIWLVWAQGVYIRGHRSNALKELRILRGRFKLAFGHKTCSSTDRTFPFLKACRDSMKRPYRGLPCLIAHSKPAIGTDRSSAAGTNHTANLPLILFSSSPSHLPISVGTHPFPTLSLISLPFVICPLKRCPVLVKPILPCLMHNIHLLFLPTSPSVCTL